MQKLKRKAKKSREVLLATDPDREGEAISWHLARVLSVDETGKCRIEFNEITETAVQNALSEPREIDQNRVDAQQAHRVLDRLVGYKLSPLLWEKVRKGLSAGRVQSVALRIVCEREVEIEEFVPEEYWTIETELQTVKKEKSTFSAKLYRINGKKFQLENEAETNQVIEELNNEALKVAKIKEGKRKRKPSAPFTTSSLQQKASNYLHFSSKKTMYIAQKLYEGLDIGNATIGLITYMRTDSNRISKEAQQEAREYIKEELGGDYLPDNAKKYKTKSGAQDAHEAIRPTSAFRTPTELKEYLSKDQYKLYKLIWQRFVASQMEPAVYKTLTVDIKGDQYWLRASGSKQLFSGFLRIDETRQQQEDTNLPKLTEGAAIDLSAVYPEQHFTNPPPRYTEAKLVKALEEKGIGRPSTYATIVGTIQDRGYVNKEGKRFKPTDLGGLVNELLVKHFPQVTDIEFTAHLENKLDKIVAGEMDWKQVLEEFYKPFAEKLEVAKENMKQVEVEEEVTEEICEKCGRNLVVKHGRYGKFLACPGFPDCKHTKPLLDKVGFDCPECEEGDVIKRTTVVF